jgi:hypothetical protein
MSNTITVNVTSGERVVLNPVITRLIDHASTHYSGARDELDHNSLGSLQGGQSGEFYHLNFEEYNNLTTGSVVGNVIANELYLDLQYRNKIVTVDNIADVDTYIPSPSVVTFPPNSFITLIQIGAGKIKLAGDADVFINGFEDGKNSAGQNSALQIITTAPGVWYVIGGVE